MAPRWLAVEHPGPWGRDVNTETGPELAALAQRASVVGMRLALIRAVQRQPAPQQVTTGSRVLLADTTPGRARLTTLSCPIEALHELDLTADQLPGTVLTEPVLLVCAHSRRDQCCAIEGRALASQLVGLVPGLWECSHLGGHRFAPTAVVLPTGYVYGRLDVTAALSAVKAAQAGEMDPGSCRGRSTWQPAGQVAELAVRERTGERDAAALTITGTDGDQVTVRHADGRQWQVAVRRQPLTGPRPSSCGGADEHGWALRAH